MLTAKNMKIVASDGEAFVRLFGDILGGMPGHVREYSWWVLELYGEGDVAHAIGRTMSDAITVIDRDGSLPVSWTELVALAQTMTQVFDLVVVGADQASIRWSPVKDMDFGELCGRCDVVIEAFDSSEWRLCGRDEMAVKSAAMLKTV